MIATAEPAVCGALGCSRTDGLETVVNGGETRVLCPRHRKHFLGVTS